MLYEGWRMDPNEGQEEFEEVSEEIRKREETVGWAGCSLIRATDECVCVHIIQESTDIEVGLQTTPTLRRRLRCLGPLTSAIFLQAFTLTFLAEWGDRSQITTIILAAREVSSQL